MKNKLFDDERNQQIYELYTTTNKSAKMIAEQFELAESTVRNIICAIKKKNANQKADSKYVEKQNNYTRGGKPNYPSNQQNFSPNKHTQINESKDLNKQITVSEYRDTNQLNKNQLEYMDKRKQAKDLEEMILGLTKK